MPVVNRPDGATLHVDARGTGPLVVLVPGLWSHPSVFSALLDDLATDHRVVTYDPRGTGQSGGHGPYDLATDGADLAAVAASEGGSATLIGAGPGGNVAVHATRAHPDLVHAVVCPTGSPVGRQASAADGEGFAGSSSVMDLLVEMAQRDYRGLLRNVIASSNPQLDDAGVRARVALTEDYTPRKVLLARSQAWLDDDPVAVSREAGDRLWILLHAADQWAPANAAATTRELLPEAHVLEVEDGPVSRPDLAAAIVRRVTGLAA